MRDSAGSLLNVNAVEVPVITVMPPENPLDIPTPRTEPLLGESTALELSLPIVPAVPASLEPPVSDINLKYLDQLFVKTLNENQLISSQAADRLASIFREILAPNALEQALLELEEDCKFCLEMQCKINGLKQEGEALKSSIFTQFLTWLNPFRDTRAQQEKAENLRIIEKAIKGYERLYPEGLKLALNKIKNIQTTFLLSPIIVNSSAIYNFKMHALIETYLGEAAANKFVDDYIGRTIASQILSKEQLVALDTEALSPLRTELDKVSSSVYADLNTLIARYKYPLNIGTIFKRISGEFKGIFSRETRSGFINVLRRVYGNYILSFHTMGDWFQALLFSGLTQNLQVNKILQTLVKIINFIYGPLFKYYVDLFAEKDKFITQQRFTVLEKIKFGIKIAIPIVLILLTFIHFEPFFNDFLLFFLIPACASLSVVVFKGLVCGFQELFCTLGWMKEYVVTDKLEDLFGDKAKAVAGFYEKQTAKLSSELNRLTRIKPSGLSDDAYSQIVRKIERIVIESDQLKQEWRILSQQSVCNNSMTGQELITMFLRRIAAKTQKKLEKQQGYIDKTLEEIITGKNIPSLVARPLLPMLAAMPQQSKIMSRDAKLNGRLELMQSIEDKAIERGLIPRPLARA